MRLWKSVAVTASSVLLLISMASAQSPVKKEPVRLQSNPPVIFDRIISTMHDSLELSKRGDGFAKQGDWQDAQDSYQQALDLYPTNADALYGMAECSLVAGDTTQEIEYDRKAFYSVSPVHPGEDAFRTNDTVKLMKFALVLNQAGHAAEARTVYNHAAVELNYMDGKPNLPLLLPLLGMGPGQVPYTSRRLQVLAHLGLGVPGIDNQFLSDEEKRGHLEEAIHLQPDLGLAYFYKGKALVSRPGHDRETRDALRAAALYGDAGTKAAVDKMMKDYSVEGNAQAEQDLEDQHKKQAAQKKQ